MGKIINANKADIQEDERLAVEVAKYPCLFDKSDKGFKERDRKLNAWTKIEEDLGYDEGIYLYLYLLMPNYKFKPYKCMNISAGP